MSLAHETNGLQESHATKRQQIHNIFRNVLEDKDGTHTAASALFTLINVTVQKLDVQRKRGVVCKL